MKCFLQDLIQDLITNDNEKGRNRRRLDPQKGIQYAIGVAHVTTAPHPIRFGSSISKQKHTSKEKGRETNLANLEDKASVTNALYRYVLFVVPLYIIHVLRFLKSLAGIATASPEPGNQAIYL